MMADVVIAILKVNLAAAVAILVVLCLRGVVRKRLGAETAYALWLIVPPAALASFLPALRTLPAHAMEPGLADFLHRTPMLAGGLLALWLVGAAILLRRLWQSQARFMRKVARGEAGPAIVGVIDPQLVLPSDFAERFTPREQSLIRAHERVHMDRDDPRANALVAVLRCIAWFNPLIHMAAERIRLDQELACDAAVVARFPKERRAYAETMLKSQLAEHVVPVGCSWQATGKHPLEARIAMLREPSPSANRQTLGRILTGLLVVAAVVSVWSALPPRPLEPPPAQASQPVMDIMIVR